jgi:hypothetical protein
VPLETPQELENDAFMASLKLFPRNLIWNKQEKKEEAWI